MTITTIYTNQVNYKSGTQHRVDTSMNHVDRLAELIAELKEDGKKIDPIQVIKATDIEGITDTYYLIDGFHRFFAQRDKLELKEVEVEVVGRGDKREALIRSLRANAEHKLALARSKGDVQNACRSAAELIKAEQLENGVDEFKIKVTADGISELVGLKPNNRTAKNAAAIINKEAKEARDGLIAELIKMGKTQSEIASASGASLGTVNKAVKDFQKVQDAQNENGNLDDFQKVHDAQNPLEASPFSLPNAEPTPFDIFADENYDPEAELQAMLNPSSIAHEINGETNPSDTPAPRKQRERTLEFELSPTQAFNLASKSFGVFEKYDISHDEAVDALKTFPERRLKEILKHYQQFTAILKDASLI